MERQVRVRMSLLGVGAMNSPRYHPAGLLVAWRGHRVALDGGDGADPGSDVDAWLVCDLRAELMPAIRRRARARGLSRLGVETYRAAGVSVRPVEVRHTSRPTYGYLVDSGAAQAIWAPEFLDFPAWAGGADLMFADAAGFARPIRFARGVGGHACVRDVAEAARANRVRRLVFAHIGRPTIRAIDQGQPPPFGEWGVEARTYQLPFRPQ